MQYFNTSSSPLYCKFERKTILQGRKSRNDPILEEFLSKIIASNGKMKLLLSEKDISLLNRLLELDQENRKIKPESIENFNDPTGSKKRIEQEKEAAKEKREKINERLEEERLFEAKVNSESNFIAPNGIPVSEQETKVSAQSNDEINMVDGHPVSLMDAVNANKANRRGRKPKNSEVLSESKNQ